ncbi:DEAD/DEAH box helicase family protein [Propionigenium maris]|uniref:DEAD/DEAH box helicase family protein n=1 Tax=Propionigenium maris TaxID=45622 RepID=UPI002493CCC9|nr:DEAD/DEAH box helicase family protein [Propionigenium maris]
MHQTLQYLEKEGIQHQLLYENLHYSILKGKANHEAFKVKHSEEEKVNATGVKVMYGKLQENIYTVGGDIDVAGNWKLGEEIFEELVRLFPFMRDTGIARTKSGGYRLNFKTDFKAEFDSKKVAKYVFKSPLPRVEVAPDEKGEIEFFFNAPATIAPTNATNWRVDRPGVYKELNDNGFPFIPGKKIKEMLLFLSDKATNPLNKQIMGIGGTTGGDSTSLSIQGEDLERLINILNLNKLKYQFKGKDVWVYKYDDGKKPDLKVNLYSKGGLFFLWDKKVMFGEKLTIRGYVESYGKEYILTPEELTRGLDRRSREEVETYYLKEGERVTQNEEFMAAIKSHTEGTLMIDGGCGIGKTTMAVEWLPRVYKRPILIGVPTTSIKDQIKEGHEEIILVGGKDKSGKKLPSFNSIKDELQPGDVVVFCYEALRETDPKELEGFVLIIDEAHKITDDAGYRELLFLVTRLQYADIGILLSGTTFDIPKVWNRLIRVKGGVKFPVKLHMFTGKNGKELTRRQKFIAFQKLRANCQKHNIPILVVCDTKLDSKEKYLGFKILTARDKDHEYYQNILKGIQPDLVGFTMLISEGVNIMTPGRVAVWLDVEPVNTKASTFIQLPQRWRKAIRIDMYVVEKLPKQSWASEKEIRKEIGKVLDSFNNKMNFINIMQDIKASIMPYLYLEDGKFKFKEEVFHVYYTLLNSGASRTRNVLNFVSEDRGWPLSIKTLDDFEDEDKETEKEVQPKKAHRKLLMNGDKLREGANLLVSVLKAGKKPEENLNLKDYYSDIVADYFKMILEPKVQVNFNRKLKEWREDREKTTEEQILDYFKVEKQFTFEVDEKIVEKILGKNNYRIDTRRFLETKDIIISVIGYVFTRGQDAKNEKIVRYILKEAGLKVREEKSIKKVIIYRNVVVGNRGTKEYKASKAMEKEMLLRARSEIS